MEQPSPQADEVAAAEMTPREALREMAIIFRDVFVALLAIVGGTMGMQWLQAPEWLLMFSFLPFGLWLWWRGKVPREVLPFLVIVFSLFTLYWFLRDLWWPNGPGWAPWVNILIYGAISSVSELLFLAWKNWVLATE